MNSFIIGDSLLRLIKGDELDYPAIVHCYPGMNCENMIQQLKTAELPKPNNIGVVIIHIGTNSCDTSRKVHKIEDVVEEINTIIRIFLTLYPDSQIIYSTILPRLDQVQERVEECNSLLLETYRNKLSSADQCRVDILDCSKDFNGCFDLYKASESNPKDPVHIGYKGSKTLQHLFNNEIIAKMKKFTRGEWTDDWEENWTSTREYIIQAEILSKNRFLISNGKKIKKMNSQKILFNNGTSKHSPSEYQTSKCETSKCETSKHETNPPDLQSVKTYNKEHQKLLTKCLDAYILQETRNASSLIYDVRFNWLT